MTVGMSLIYLKVKSFDKKEAQENKASVVRLERSRKVASHAAFLLGHCFRPGHLQLLQGSMR